MTLEVPGRGTHVFTIDTSVPPDDAVAFARSASATIRSSATWSVDGVQFQHNYLTPDGVLQFHVLAAFFTADTSVINGLFLPMTPDPRLGTGIERAALDPCAPAELGNLCLAFLHRSCACPEPGSLALFAWDFACFGAGETARSGDRLSTLRSQPSLLAPSGELTWAQPVHPCGHDGHQDPAMSLISELKRRNVFRVALLYLVAGWVILQVASCCLTS